MKRLTLFLVAAVLAVALLAVIAYAQIGGRGTVDPALALEMTGGPPPEGPEAAPMGWGRMGPSAIAASAGFVYVVSGGMLLQYDQSLNLVNHVELPAAARGAGPGAGMGRRGMGGGGAEGGRTGGRRGGGGGGGRGMRGRVE